MTELHAFGDQNVQVANVSGSSITVIYGGKSRRLPIERPVIELSATSRSPSTMLHPRYGVVPFIGQEDLKAKIVSWLEEPQPFSARIIAGRAGMGKTRLAVELAQLAVHRDWLSGLLKVSPDPAALEELAFVPKRRLVVIDYSETRLEDLSELLSMLADAATPDAPARALLLIRRPSQQGPTDDEIESWKMPLRHHHPQLSSMVDSFPVDVLRPQAWEAASRVQLYRAAFEAFKTGAAVRATDLERIEGDDLLSPLQVTITAFVDSTRSRSSSGGPIEELLRHEDNYWRRAADRAAVALPQPEQRARVVALVTLTAATDRDAATCALRILEEFSDASNERCRQVVDWARSLYPGENFWNPLEPDLIGEHLVARTFVEDLKVLDDARAVCAGTRVITVLSRVIDASFGPVSIRASEILTSTAPHLGLHEILSLAGSLDDVPDPTAVGNAIIRWSNAATGNHPLARHVLKGVIETEAVSIYSRLEALEWILEDVVSSYGFPWRLKDHDSGSWKTTWLGRVLSGLIESNPEPTLDLLSSWLLDNRRLHVQGEASRPDIATAVLIDRIDRASTRYETLLRQSRDEACALLRRTAKCEALPIATIGRRWASSSNPLLMDGAMAICAGLRENQQSASESLREHILSALVQAEWPGRPGAISELAAIRPDSAELRDQVLAAVADGTMSPWSLTPFLDLFPVLATRAMSSLSANRDAVDTCLNILRDWFPGADTADLEVMRIVEAGLDQHDLKQAVGLFCEYALYGLHAGKQVSDHRLQLVVDRYRQGDDSTRTCISYGLSLGPGPARYEQVRWDAIEQCLRQPDVAETQIRDLLSGMIAQSGFVSRENAGQPEMTDWPTDEVVVRLLGFVDEAARAGALLSVAFSSANDRWAKQVARLASDDTAPPSQELDRFIEIIDAGGSVHDAILDAMGKD